MLQPSSANIEDIDLTRIATNTSYTATEAGILSCLWWKQKGKTKQKKKMGKERCGNYVASPSSYVNSNVFFPKETHNKPAWKLIKSLMYSVL